jgi:thioredoxin 1
LKRLEKEEELSLFLQVNKEKTVLVKFFTTWCLPCRELQKNLESLLSERKGLEILEVDAEKFREIAQRSEFAVRSVPTLFLFHNGKMVRKASGSMNVYQLKEFISSY